MTPVRRAAVSTVALLLGLALAFALVQARTSSAAEPAPNFTTQNPLTFDFVGVGTTSPVRTSPIKNTGNAVLKITKIELYGQNGADFHLVADGCTGASLAPTQSCSIGVTFSPTAAGTRIAALRFTDNTPCHSWITLAGSGTDTPAPALAHSAVCETGQSADPAGGTGTTTTTTTTTTTPGTTTTPQGGSGVSGASVIGLPHSCVSRRTVTVGLTAPKGKSFTSVKFLLRGKTIKTLKGKSIKTKISLAGLPRGRFTLEVRARTTDGKSYDRKRHYVTCVADKS